MIDLLRKIPGFRSGKWFNALIASGFYFFAFLILIVIIPPSAPTLALDKVDPTNKSSISIAGKTYAGKPVYLLKDNEIAQSSSYPPDIKYQNKFIEAQKQAREEKKGLRGEVCNPTTTESSTTTSTN